MELLLFAIVLILIGTNIALYGIGRDLRRIVRALEKQSGIASPEDTADPDPFHDM